MFVTPCGKEWLACDVTHHDYFFLLKTSRRWCVHTLVRTVLLGYCCAAWQTRAAQCSRDDQTYLRHQHAWPFPLGARLRWRNTRGLEQQQRDGWATNFVWKILFPLQTIKIKIRYKIRTLHHVTRPPSKPQKPLKLSDTPRRTWAIFWCLNLNPHGSCCPACSSHCWWCLSVSLRLSGGPKPMGWGHVWLCSCCSSIMGCPEVFLFPAEHLQPITCPSAPSAISHVWSSNFPQTPSKNTCTELL